MDLVIPATTKLTANFTLAELCHSNTAQAHNIPNLPNSYEHFRNLILLTETALQPAREAVGPITVNDAYRNAAVNALVGGVSNSDHQVGLAADLKPIAVSVVALARWFVLNLPEFDQVILEYGTRQNPTTVHIGMGSRMRRDVYYTPDLKTYTRITL